MNQMHGSFRRKPGAALALLSGVLLGFLAGRNIAAQDFQIVWVVVGEAEANTGKRPARAGRHLFMASELMALSMRNVKVSRIDVSPAVNEIATGTRLCVSSLNIMAYDTDGAVLEAAPLSISVRQDQKLKLDMSRGKNDICVRPIEAGEYPLRFASLLPARDGTTRGAQIFLRVTAANASASGSPAGPSAQPQARADAKPYSSFHPQFLNQPGYAPHY